MRTLAIIIALVVAALLLPLAFPGKPVEQTSAAAEMLPWNITLQADGSSRVFGLTPGRSTLAEASATFRVTPEIAIIGKRDETGSLEAFFDGVQLNQLNGKLIVTADISAEALQAMRNRASKSEYMESATLRSTLIPEDRQHALALPMRALVFVPAARLDESIILERFGQPGERIKTADGVQHFLYAERGVDVALNDKGKAMLQYVQPAQFALVRQPLLSAQ